MPNVVGSVPEFTTDDTATNVPVITGEEGTEGVIKAPTEEVGEETDTLTEPPAESADAEQKPSVESGEDTEQPDLHKAIQGLQEERSKLLKEISELKGQRRDIKQEQLIKVEQQIDDLQDVNPQDISLIERVLKSKGYVRKEEVQQEFYERVKQEELESFLDKYPELKPENDPNDLNWSSLQKELGFYRMPENPRLIGQVLERAYRGIKPAVSDRTIPAKKRQIEVAGAGAGGGQRSSSSAKTLEPRYREQLLRGGWSEEDIKNIELNLPN